MLIFKFFESLFFPVGDTGGPLIPAFPPIGFQAGHKQGIIFEPEPVLILKLLQSHFLLWCKGFIKSTGSQSKETILVLIGCREVGLVRGGNPCTGSFSSG